MDCEYDESSEFNTSDVDWGEEPNDSCEEDDDHGNVSWSGETDSEISYGEEPECERHTPEHDELSSNEGSWHEDDYSVSDHEYEPRGGEPEPEPPDYDRDDTNQDEEPWNHEPEPGDNTEYEPEPDEEDHEPNEANNYTELEDYSTDDEIDFEPYPIYFAGHHQGPEAYSRWEKDMEGWFQENQVSDEKKVSYAEDTLTEDAFRHWDQDANSRLEYEVPDASWEEMKEIMREEFVNDAEENRQSSIKVYTNPEPRRWLLATRPTPKAKPPGERLHKKKKWSPSIKEKTKARLLVQVKDVPQDPIQQVVASKSSTRPLLQSHGKTKQGKSSNSSNNNDTICYRCHKRGHFARTCPTRQIVTTSLKELDTEKSNKVEEIVECEIQNSNSFIMHLSLPRDVDAGTKKAKEKSATHEPPDSPYHTQGETRRDSINARSNSTRDDDIVCRSHKNGVIYSMLIKEEPPDAPCQLHLNPNQNDTRGKLLNSHFYRDTNLLYLGAGKEVSRTKPFQGGGYDEDIQPAVTPGDYPSDMKAHGIATAFGMGCTGCTAGLDPRPIGNSGSIPEVGTVAPKLLQLQAKNSRHLVFERCDLDLHSMNLDVPRHHLFSPKLSRLKCSSTSLIWSRFGHYHPTASF